ncbi:hypothetical protein [Streptomyces sp. CBMA123]|uniref:hypothetical protein n=1 Tax=Streptomyces sp. CBMA123 TaxID=1896313 RepID=UPI001661ECE8|nr:hypothetical protein [Streptomyces sp. CBMA123]MBD0692070.1 hypothetical protein [Streptomyces sp. CBMA123]
MTHRTTDRPVIDPADLAVLEETVGLIRSARLEDILAELPPTVGPRKRADLARHCTLIHAAAPLFTAAPAELPEAAGLRLTAPGPPPLDGFLLRARRRPANGVPGAGR